MALPDCKVTQDYCPKCKKYKKDVGADDPGEKRRSAFGKDKQCFGTKLRSNCNNLHELCPFTHNHHVSSDPSFAMICNVV